MRVPTVLVVAITLIVGMTLASIVGVHITGNPGEDQTPFITTVIGFVTLAITTLVSLLRNEQTREEIKAVRTDTTKLTNGYLRQQVKRALREGIDEIAEETMRPEKGKEQ